MAKTQDIQRIHRLVTLLLIGFSLWACQPPIVPLQNQAIQSLKSINRFQLQNTLPSNQLSTTNRGDVFLKDVPFVQQGEDNTCGQAVATTLLQYWGHKIDYQTVVNESNPLNLGTSYQALQGYLRQKGLYAQAYRQGSIELIIELIKRGRPVIALLDFGGLQWEHYVVVVGYNLQRKTLIIHESNSNPFVEISQKSFKEHWKNQSLINLPFIGGNSYENLMFDVGSEALVTETKLSNS